VGEKYWGKCLEKREKRLDTKWKKKIFEKRGRVLLHFNLFLVVDCISKSFLGC
jgi:hypothetical protein